ncbi:MAG: hypothetical protein ABR998_06725 [Gemmatimonadales bacterium]
MTIDTDRYSARLRSRAIFPGERKVLIARLSGSEQEMDLAAPVNCGGYGRVRHFRLARHLDWSPDPLPIVPAAAALAQLPSSALRAQVFQNAACNWRCWYCFVDYDRLSANLRVAKYFTAEELIDLYLREPARPEVLDLSGGQPDLVPEWTLWTLQALEARGYAGRVFVWSDDNLSNCYLWKYTTPEQRMYMAKFPAYARVGCFKGFDRASFAFNTATGAERFDEQFDVFRDLLREGFDMYGYVTFTSPPHPRVREAMARFVDRLAQVHPKLPLRVVPLKIEVFTPTRRRMQEARQQALAFQHDVHAAWIEELASRFSSNERAAPINQVSLVE